LKQIIVIVLALLVGLAGLLMSVCGGVLLFSTLKSGVRAAGSFVPALIALGIGVGLVWLAFNLIVSRREDRPPRDRD
jgi:hypothetical protein